MPRTAQALWLVLLVLSVGVWLGGYVTIAVVARASARSLAPAARVAFFRALGRAYLPVGSGALALGLVSGGVLLRGRAVDGLSIAAVIAAGLLVLFLAVAVAQARRMTRLRQRASATPSDDHLPVGALPGAGVATVLRALLGVLSLALVVIGCLMAVVGPL